MSRLSLGGIDGPLLLSIIKVFTLFLNMRNIVGGG